MYSRWHCSQPEIEKVCAFPPIVVVEQLGRVPLELSTQNIIYSHMMSGTEWELILLSTSLHKERGSTGKWSI